MTIAVLGQYVPPPPPPPLNPGWDAIEVLWTGWDGSQWLLSNPADGVFIVRGGMRGLGEPKIIHYRDKSPAVAGAYWRGLSYDPRDVFWPIYLFADNGTKEWVDLDRAFWKSLHPEHEGILRVTLPGISSRTLQLRLEGDNDWQPKMDPTFFGWAEYAVNLQADQPFWQGEVIPFTWLPGTPVDFHGGTGAGAPIIRISSSKTLQTATITNPGDVETFAAWTVHGPTDAGGAVISVDGHLIEVPLTLAAGDTVRVDTHPAAQTAYKTTAAGVVTDVFAQLGATDFAPVAAGDTAALVLTSTSTGYISAELPPLYLRAW